MAAAPVHAETGRLGRPAIVVHGGAGTFARFPKPAARRSLLGPALRAALDAGWEVLGSRGGALQAAVEAVACMEASGLFNAGRGSVPTTAGTIEADASVMDGTSGAAGAVCCATWPASPVRAALAVASSPACLAPSGGGPPWRPLLLAGPGADRFAQEAGLAGREGPRRGPEGTGRAGPCPPGANPGSTAGTVGAVALDASGNVAAATSTGGRPGQPPGRVGDSALIGAGTWASNQTAAVSATGTGEAFVMAGFAHEVDRSMRRGTPLAQALQDALGEVSRWGGSGGAVAISASGELAAVFSTPAMARAWRGQGTQAIFA